MRSLLFALLLSVTAAAAEDAAPAGQNAAPPAAAPAAGRYAPEITEIMKDLSLLLERGAEVKPEKLDALAAELRSFDAKVKDALGAELLAQAAEKENRARAAAARKALQGLRVRLQAYYAEKGGAYPAGLAALGGEIPELELPGHLRTAGVTVIDSKEYDKEPGKAGADTGGWLYFSAPDSANYGLLLLDCAHKDADGAEFRKY